MQVSLPPSPSPSLNLHDPERFTQMCTNSAFIACTRNCGELESIANAIAFALDNGVLPPKEDLTLLQGVAAHFAALHRSLCADQGADSTAILADCSHRVLGRVAGCR